MKDGSPDENNSLRKLLVEEASKRKKNGACLRWQVSTDVNLDLVLQLQALPAPQATVASKPVLSTDNAAVMLVDSWKLDVDKFDRSTGLYGPIPDFFTGEADSMWMTLQTIKSRLYDQLNKFYTR